MTNITGTTREGEFPSEIVAISAEHSMVFPGESVHVDVNGGDLDYLGAVRLELVDEIGSSIATIPVVDRSINFAIPPGTKTGRYLLHIKYGKWSLDAISLEVADESVAILTRKLLLASMRQAEAFDALQLPDIDLDRTFEAANEAERLYIEADEQELASETWADLALALRNLNMIEYANEAATRSLKIGHSASSY